MDGLVAHSHSDKKDKVESEKGKGSEMSLSLQGKLGLKGSAQTLCEGRETFYKQEQAVTSLSLSLKTELKESIRGFLLLHSNVTG